MGDKLFMLIVFIHNYVKTSLLELDPNFFKYSDQWSSTLSVRAFISI